MGVYGARRLQSAHEEEWTTKRKKAKGNGEHEEFSRALPNCRWPFWEGVWPFLDPWDVVGLRTTSSVWNVPGKYGPHGELFFFLIKKEPFALTRAVEFKPFVLAETLGACALIGPAPDARRCIWVLVLRCLFAGEHWVTRCTTTTSAGLLRSCQARWRSFSI